MSHMGFPSDIVVKNLSANSEDISGTGSISGSRRSLEVGTDNLLQCSCLENSIEEPDGL